MKTLRPPARRKQRRGAALVEAALVLPVFVGVTLGIVEFGRAMMIGQLVTNAAREGARLAIIEGSTNSDVEATVRNFLQQSAGASAANVGITITIAQATGNPNPGGSLESSHSKDVVTVRVEVPFSSVSFVKGSFLEGKKLVGQSTMLHE